MRTKRIVFGFLAIATSLLASCNSNGNNKTTIINQGLDCGLVRADLVGVWSVTLDLATPTLQSCTGLANPSGSITTADFPATYGTSLAPVDVFGSDGSTSFKILSDRNDGNNDATVTDELDGSVQADSCLAITRVWDRTDGLYIQCIGTLTVSSGVLSGSCDSVEIDSDANGQLDTSCSLSSRINFTASIS